MFVLVVCFRFSFVLFVRLHCIVFLCLLDFKYFYFFCRCINGTGEFDAGGTPQ